MIRNERVALAVEELTHRVPRPSVRVDDGVRVPRHTDSEVVLVLSRVDQAVHDASELDLFGVADAGRVLDGPGVNSVGTERGRRRTGDMKVVGPRMEFDPDHEVPRLVPQAAAAGSHGSATRVIVKETNGVDRAAGEEYDSTLLRQLETEHVEIGGVVDYAANR